MKDHGINNAILDPERQTYLGCHLHPDAAEAGLNFLTPELHLLALRELLLLREEDAAVDEDRLLSNSLSSMPLSINCFGPLALDTKLASKVMRQLLPDFVHSVQRIAWEHSPGRRDPRYLQDRSAFDLAIHIATPQGEAGIVYVEVKFTEDMASNAPARWRDRYAQALHDVQLYKNPESPILRSAPIEQLMREHSLAQLSVDNGDIPRAMFIAFGPRLNRQAHAAFMVYANELRPIPEGDRTRVPFRHFTLETFINALDAAGDPDTAKRLWQRYCDFQRVYNTALAVFAPRLQPTGPANPGNPAHTPSTRGRPRNAAPIPASASSQSNTQAPSPSTETESSRND